MIVDSAHYKDGVRQHEDALSPERAAELRRAAGSAEFVWIGIHEPDPGDMERLASLRRASLVLWQVSRLLEKLLEASSRLGRQRRRLLGHGDSL